MSLPKGLKLTWHLCFGETPRLGSILGQVLSAAEVIETLQKKPGPGSMACSAARLQTCCKVSSKNHQTSDLYIYTKKPLAEADNFCGSEDCNPQMLNFGPTCEPRLCPHSLVQCVHPKNSTFEVKESGLLQPRLSTRPVFLGVQYVQFAPFRAGLRRTCTWSLESLCSANQSYTSKVAMPCATGNCVGDLPNPFAHPSLSSVFKRARACIDGGTTSCQATYCSFSSWQRSCSSSNQALTQGSTASKRSGSGS